MFTKGDLQLPPPQIIIFNILRNIQEKGISLNHIFHDQNLIPEPMMFQFNSSLAILIHGDSEYKV